VEFDHSTRRSFDSPNQRLDRYVNFVGVAHG
jgi:hypothetical protein